MAIKGVKYTPSAEHRLFVEQATMAGAGTIKISECLGIDPTTLQKYFKLELLTGRQRLKNKALRVVLDRLEEGSLDAAKFVLARTAGWTERHDLTSSDGSMTPSRVSLAITTTDPREAAEAYSRLVLGDMRDQGAPESEDTNGGDPRV